MAWLRFLSLLLLSVWIGGLAILGGVVAPVVFAVLETHDPVAGRTLAGTLFGAIFERFQPLAWMLGGMLITVLAARAMLGPTPRRIGLRIGIIGGMLAASLASALVIAPRIDRIRLDTPGPVASLRDDDPRRVEFNRLHGLSNGLMLLTFIAGVGLLRLDVGDEPAATSL